ncbi:ABC transporter ATP-binding protein [Marispirochaeta sp.]|uniref:ABC transporter ATP-binding protein n=1 Tax=Marispirochaeta sp. TaxID=2038653 RepID=UPI0029C7FFA5|nr:ABC transporter ATP-binding protein [Marispirochaeta sp.]
MISVEELTKNYGPVRAVDSASFSVQAGETVGFLGPNGAGKTTTMRIMTGLFTPSSGDVKVDGYSILTNPLEVKQRIGYLPESAPVYLDMTVQGYLRFVCEIKQVPSGERSGQIDKVISECGLETVRTRTARKLSKGYRQRLGLAQALIGDPPVIILDEPTVGLDPTQTFEFRKLIQGLKGTRTVILSSHILPEVSMICDRVVIISNGKILAQDSPEALAQRLQSHSEFLVTIDGPENEVTAELETLQEIRDIQVVHHPVSGGVQFRIAADPDNDPRDKMVKMLVEKERRLLELSVHTAGLEDVFLNLVTEEGTAE